MEEIDGNAIANCFHIESLIKQKVLEGTHDIKSLVNYIEKFYIPKSELEEELYSEAIVYARCALLN